MNSQHNIIDTLSDFLYTTKKPVSFKEFCESKDFCNDQSVYQFWKDEIENTPLTTSEVIVDGSLGGGKSMAIGGFYTAYRLYCLFLNGDPRPRLGLAPRSELFILYFSVSLKMANKSGFKYIYNAIQCCKWFKDNMPMNEEVTSSVSFPKHKVTIDYASAEGHQIGLNVWAFILDESNFRSGVGEGLISEYEEVTQLYTQLIDRQNSRFSQADGSVDALAILISSASYQSSFVEKRKELVADDPHTKMITAVTYLIRPEKYSKETFEVFIGTGTIDPCIVENDKHRETIVRQLKMEHTGIEEGYFRKVPINIKKPFKINPALALQNYCGISTQIKGRFMKNLKPLKESYYENKSPWFNKVQIELSNGDSVELMDYLIEENIEFPERPHSFFIDLSVAGDTGGFSCVRFDGIENGIRMHTHVFTLEIEPPPYPNETRISKIKKFMLAISEVVNIAAFGSDQYQSKQLRQDILAELDLTDNRLSIDSSDLFHLHWLRALVEKALKMIHSPKLETEVEEAEHDMKKRRVVKKKGSTDDLFQSVVGAYFLSDTVGAEEDVQLNIPSSNLIGGQSVQRVLKRLGYK